MSDNKKKCSNWLNERKCYVIYSSSEQTSATDPWLHIKHSLFTEKPSQIDQQFHKGLVASSVNKQEENRCGKKEIDIFDRWEMWLEK